MMIHAQVQKVLSEGVQLSTLTTFFFLFDELMTGGRIQIPLLAGHQWPVGEMPFKRRFPGGSMMAQH